MTSSAAGAISSCPNSAPYIGIRELTNSSAELTKGHLGTVLGGRIGPERPATTDVKTAGLVDVDIESCYGTALKALSVPIGHPTQLYYSRSEPQTWPCLAAFLDRWGDELVPGCWMAVVDTAGPYWVGPRSDLLTFEGRLSFPQDFLLSKITTGKSGAPSFAELGGRGWGYEQQQEGDSSAHIQGSSRLMRNEVKNGVLTSSSLALQRCKPPPAEWTELLSVLRVKAATIYPKSTQEPSYTWAQRVLADKDRCRLRTFAYRRAHGLVDSRPGAWMQVPLKALLAPPKLKPAKPPLRANTSSSSLTACTVSWPRPISWKTIRWWPITSLTSRGSCCGS